jgi:hypothetical protein
MDRQSNGGRQSMDHQPNAGAADNGELTAGLLEGRAKGMGVRMEHLLQQQQQQQQQQQMRLVQQQGGKCRCGWIGGGVCVCVCVF